MSIKKNTNYNFIYKFAEGNDALKFEKVLTRLFKKYLVKYENNNSFGN